LQYYNIQFLPPYTPQLNVISSLPFVTLLDHRDLLRRTEEEGRAEVVQGSTGAGVGHFRCDRRFRPPVLPEDLQTPVVADDLCLQPGGSGVIAVCA